MLSFTNDLFLWGLAILAASYLGFRTVAGWRRYAVLMKELRGEGLLRSQRWVLIRFHFLLVRRITFAHIFLSKRRIVLFHYFTRRLILQTPLGLKGTAGKAEGRFETEGEGNSQRLVFRTTVRGGGRIRMRLENGAGWLEDIRANGPEGP